MLSFLLTISDEEYHPRIAEIYNSYHDDMIRIAKYRLKRADIPDYAVYAEDAVQNSFSKIVKHIDKIDFNVPEKYLKSYVFSIVINEVINIISNIEYVESLDDYAENLDDREFMQRLKVKEVFDEVVRAIKKMDERYSTVLLFHYCNDMNVKEIAEMLGVSEKTVYTRLFRGKALLAKKVKEIDYDL